LSSDGGAVLLKAAERQYGLIAGFAEELNQPVWRRPGDPSLFRAIAAVWAFGRATTRRTPSPGVRKLREHPVGQREAAGILTPGSACR